jgi:hypothetical protein
MSHSDRIKHLLEKGPSAELTAARTDAFNAGYGRATKQPNFNGDISGEHRHVSVMIEKGGQKWIATESSGFIGNSASVFRHESTARQQAISHGSGRDAAHRQGRQSGGSAGDENLSKFNSPMNRVEQLHRVENMLQKKIDSGSAVFLIVRDMYRVNPTKVKGEAGAQYGPSCPHFRVYEWAEFKPNGQVETGKAPIHGNWSHPAPTERPPDAQSSKPSVPANLVGLISNREAFRQTAATAPAGSQPAAKSNSPAAVASHTPQGGGSSAKRPDVQQIRSALSRTPARTLGAGAAFRAVPIAAAKTFAQSVASVTARSGRTTNS